MSLKFYEICFKITAVGNVVAAIVAMASIENHLGLAYGPVEINPLIRFYHFGFWSLVLALGVSYWWLAKDPFKLKIIAFAGGLGKLFVAAGFVYLIMTGHAMPLTIFGLAYDGFFGIVMLLFFFTAKENP